MAWAAALSVHPSSTTRRANSRRSRVTPSQRDYQDWARGHRDRPAASTLKSAFGRTFGEWIRLVEERLLAEKKTA